MPGLDENALVERIRKLSRPLQPEPTDVPERISTLEGIRAVLFDVYGTLIISGSGDISIGNAEDDERQFREALQATGLDTRALDDTRRGTVLLEEAILEDHQRRRGEGVVYPEVDIVKVWQRVLERLPGLSGSPVTLEQARVVAVEYECRVNPVWPMPGLAKLLGELRAADLPLGIVSNAQFYTPLMFKAFLNATPEELGFDPTLCVWSYQALEGKPAPGLFARALAALDDGYGIQPDQVVYVGNDRLKDIWPASKLGCRSVLFAGDRRSLRLREDDPRCRHVQPDAVISHLSGLSRVLPR